MKTVEEVCDELGDHMKVWVRAEIARKANKTPNTKLKIAGELTEVADITRELVASLDARIQSDPNYKWTTGEKLRDCFRSKTDEQACGHYFFATALWKKAQHDATLMLALFIHYAEHLDARAAAWVASDTKDKAGVAGE